MMKKYPKKSRQSIEEVPKKATKESRRQERAKYPNKKRNLDQEDTSTSQPHKCKSNQPKNINRSVLTLHLTHPSKLISLNWCTLLKEDK